MPCRKTRTYRFGAVKDHKVIVRRVLILHERLGSENVLKKKVLYAIRDDYRTYFSFVSLLNRTFTYYTYNKQF